MIIFRVNASKEIGYGHLTRCLALARELKNEDRIIFSVDTKPAKKMVHKFRFKCHVEIHIIVDEYKIDKIDNKCLAVFDLKTFGITDLTLIGYFKSRRVPCIQITDLGLNQQRGIDYFIDPSISKLYQYHGKNVLSGPDYAILHEQYAIYHGKEKPINKNIKNVLISLGGAGSYRHYQQIIEKLRSFQYRIFIAPGFCLNVIQKWLLEEKTNEIHIIKRSESLAFWLHYADLAVLAAGNVAYEAACCGCPALYFHGEIQGRIANQFHQAGAGLCVRSLDRIKEVDFAPILQKLTFEKRLKMSEAGKKLVNGQGAKKVVKVIKEIKK